jgi:hypothetical protein
MTLANVAILAGCFGLGMTVLLAWWDTISVTLYRRDLEAIVADLDRAMEGKKEADDLRYRGLRLLATRILIPEAPSFSLAAILIFSKMPSPRARQGGELSGVHTAELPSQVIDLISEVKKAIVENPIPEVSAAATKIFVRSIIYMLFGSVLSMPCLLLLCVTGGWTSLNQAVGNAVADLKDAELTAVAALRRPVVN